MNPRITRRLAAVLVAAIGLMNIVSAVHPVTHARLELLLDLESIDVVRGSRIATVLSGFVLILLADGLYKRRRRAMQMAVAILALSTVFHLTKGLDFEEAILTGMLDAWLWARRDVFSIQCRAVAPYRLSQRLGQALVLYWGYVILGFVVLRHAVRPAPMLLDVLVEPLRLFVGTPHYLYVTEQARWFADSLTLVASVFVVYGVALALRPFIPLNRATSTDIERARNLVERYGSDTVSYFALQDGRSLFFHSSRDAFLSYRLWDNVALVGGDPTCRASTNSNLWRSSTTSSGPGGAVASWPMRTCFPSRNLCWSWFSRRTR